MSKFKVGDMVRIHEYGFPKWLRGRPLKLIYLCYEETQAVVECVHSPKLIRVIELGSLADYSSSEKTI